MAGGNHWDDCLEVVERAIGQILIEESRAAGEFPRIHQQLPKDWQEWGQRVAAASEETVRV